MRSIQAFLVLVASCLALVVSLVPAASGAEKSEKSEKSRDPAKPRWLEDLPAAKVEAARERKAILLDFTGSDWCTFCRKFKKEVLDQPEFLGFARTNLVLVEVDFPERKRQAAALAQANEALKTRFAVGIFPTFVLLSSEGNELGRQVGYLRGGPKAFIAKLEQFRSAAP